MTTQQLQPGREGQAWEDARTARFAPARRTGNSDQLVRALGWFSIGLGLFELAAPGTLARLIGLPEDARTRWVVCGLGMREIATGTGLVVSRRPAPWMWGRVAGDVMDLALLGAALRAEGARPGRIGVAAAAVGGVLLLDVLSGQRLTPRTADGTVRVRQSITIARPPEEVYRFWRDFRNLPRFMGHLESVELRDGGRSHWVARAPGGRTVAWDAEVTEDRPNERLAWRSLEGADVDNTGTVRFERATGGRGTVVRVEFRYRPPAGRLGATVARLFGEEPNQQVSDALRALKQVLETGEVVQAAGALDRQQPAQPPPRIGG